jgi:hypothetical protein
MYPVCSPQQSSRWRHVQIYVLPGSSFTDYISRRSPSKFLYTASFRTLIINCRDISTAVASKLDHAVSRAAQKSVYSSKAAAATVWLFRLQGAWWSSSISFTWYNPRLPIDVEIPTDLWLPEKSHRKHGVNSYESPDKYESISHPLGPLWLPPDSH